MFLPCINTFDHCVVLLQVPKWFWLLQIIFARPKIYLHTVTAQNILGQGISVVQDLHLKSSKLKRKLLRLQKSEQWTVKANEALSSAFESSLEVLVWVRTSYEPSNQTRYINITFILKAKNRTRWISLEQVKDWNFPCNNLLLRLNHPWKFFFHVKI